MANTYLRLSTAAGTVHAMSRNDPRVTLCRRMYDGAITDAAITCARCAKRAVANTPPALSAHCVVCNDDGGCEFCPKVDVTT